ncbi:hypothetical protein CI109_103415 [Kwoniella shandongensis]|uniref:Uncharacterized protein n=1 Tax=Kwoniella shandongensis TaxID=1734106 RepID=A0A5M6BWW0_9TREE|nr:uncharacterized protein CI109_004496 [Kwoniella shandongensis]KAA5527203.1 hypothetical protein CI109_004496 [Kwoniella shandongensis]
MGCFPCNNLQPEVAHLNACYPPSKALLTSGPEYRPLSQDLSKLTYFATNKPSKLAKIGEELDKRVIKETQRSTAGYPKYRASLLISLAILRALLTECKRDIGLFGRWALRVIDRSLDVRVYQRGGLDLEVIGRAAAAFISFTTYTDGSAIGVDDPLTRTYLDILSKFGKMATHVDPQEKTDMEEQNRTRLIALAALHGAVTSDALYTSTREFPKQVGFILPPLMQNVFEGTMDHLKLETAKIEMDASPSPFFTEFSARRPINDRRAPSLHAHVPGEKGPSSSDVLSASLRSLHLLVGQCQVTQASHIIDRVGVFLDKQGSWQDVERCCWISERLTAWITLQYRFVVPTRLVEVLVDLKDEAPTPKHTSVLAMITTILNSTTSLVGLGVSDLLQNLVSLIVRRIHFDPRDALLPPLVQCVSSLGTHIYYADQINDIVEELAVRIAELPTADKARPEIIRVLIHCITGVMVVADAADEEAETKINNNSLSRISSKVTNDNNTQIHADKGKAPATGPISPDTPHEQQLHRHRSSRRNPIAPEVWQETLPLLCEADYAVRSTYARALILYLETEMPRGASPSKQSQSGSKSAGGDFTIYRFCNALNAAIYTLVMSSCLGVGVDNNTQTGGPSSRASPEVHHAAFNDNSTTETNKVEPSHDGTDSRGTPTRSDKEKGVSFNITEPSPTSTPPNGSSGNGGTSTPPHKRAVRTSRRPSLPLNRYQSYVHLNSFDNVATPLDFSAALRILDEIHSIVPIPALLTGAPMLLALDKDAGNELVRRPGDGRAGAWVLERKRAIREMLGIIWRRIGERWGLEEIEALAEKGLASLPEPYLIPPLPSYSQNTILPMPEPAMSFVQHTMEGESSSATKPLLDSEVILSSLTGAKVVQGVTKGDEKALKRKFGSRWTVESAIKDSVERFSSANIVPADDPHYDVAHVLMSLNNGSYQSFNGNGGARPVSRSIDVGDLREAIGGRRDTITTSAAPSIISTIADDHLSAISRGGAAVGAGAGAGAGGSSLISTNGSSSLTGIGAGRKPQPDVREVLKDIFKDKKRGASGRVSHGHGHGAGGSVPHSPLSATGTAGSGAGSKVNGDGDGDKVNGDREREVEVVSSGVQGAAGESKVNGAGAPVLAAVAGSA